MAASDFSIESIAIAHKFRAPKLWYSSEYARERPRHGIIYVLEGSAVYEMSDGSSFTAVKDDVLYMPKGENYMTYCPEEDFIHMTVNFDMQGTLPLPRRRQCKSGEKTRGDIGRIVTVWSARAPYYREQSIGLLYLLLCSQIEISQNRDLGERQTQLSAAIEILSGDYSQNVSISALAESCGISETYFRKLFAKTYGVSPMAYLTNRRISYARELLLNTELSIERVSFESGYRDPAYFCRIFKKSTGMAPGEYRNGGAV